MTAHELQAAAIAQAEESGALLTRYLERVDQVRGFVTAFTYAARYIDHAPADSELYWPSLMEGLQRLFPDDSKLEAACHKTLLALHALSEGADPRGAPPSAPAAGAKRTTRAALAAVATQPQ